MGSKILTTRDGFKIYNHPSANKKHKETVVFVHHMLGSHRSTARHYRYLNELGFDCISFDLLLGSKKLKKKYHPLLRYLYKGVFYIWARQIRQILDQVAGDKIIYAFSGPCVSALWASENRADVKKVICDGGPFQQIYSNSKNLFSKVLFIKSEPLNSILSFLAISIWGYKPIAKLHRVLNQWPENKPILSIRGCLDDIVSLESIDKVFKSHKNLDLTVFEIQNGTHLNGLRDFPVEYKTALSQFI